MEIEKDRERERERESVSDRISIIFINERYIYIYIAYTAHLSSMLQKKKIAKLHLKLVHYNLTLYYL